MRQDAVDEGEVDARVQNPMNRLDWLRSGLIASACVFLGFLARLAVDVFIHGLAPFATFYPAVIAAGLLGGVRAGVIGVIIATPLVVWASGALYPIATTAVWIIMASVVAAAGGAVRDLSLRLRAERDELTRTQARLELALREQVHRAKNTLAVLTALANQTAHGASSVEDFRDRLTERIRALSAAYGLLSAQEHDAPLDLAEIVETALSPFRAARADRVVVKPGPPARLAPSIGIPLTLCLNELATNAVKYGALSGSSGGRVECDWIERTPGRFELRWRECDGPAVAPPASPGFGMRMIQAASREMPGGSVDLRFPPSGVACDFTFDAFAAHGPRPPPK